MRFNIKDLIPEEYHKLMLGDAFDRYDAELELDRKMYGDEDRLYEGFSDADLIDIKGIKYLYHATKKLYLKNIQKNGLVSKSKSKIANHPERIYLAYTQEGAEKFAKHPTNLVRTPVLKHGKPETLPVSAKKLYSTVVILRIFTTRLPHTLKAYVDPNYKDEGCYTLNTIPWSAIDIVKEIEQ